MTTMGGMSGGVDLEGYGTFWVAEAMGWSLVIESILQCVQTVEEAA